MGHTIKELAEKLVAFPSEIEYIVRALHRDGLVKVIWCEGELYVSFENDKDIDELESLMKVKEHVDNPMFN